MYKKTKLHPDTGYKNGEDDTGERKLPPDYQEALDNTLWFRIKKEIRFLRTSLIWFGKKYLKLILGILFLLFVYGFSNYINTGGQPNIMLYCDPPAKCIKKHNWE